MMYSDNELAIMMLCMQRQEGESSNIQPLNVIEWAAFMENLVKFKREPSIILSSFQRAVLDMGYDETFLMRLNVLSKRGTLMAMRIDNSAKKGINTYACISRDYPTLIRRNLNYFAPAVIQCAGDSELIKKAGIIFAVKDADYRYYNDYSNDVMKCLGGQLISIYAEGNIKPAASVNIGFVKGQLSDYIKNKNLTKRLIDGSSVIISAVSEGTMEIDYNLKLALAHSYVRILCGNESENNTYFDINDSNFSHTFYQSKLPDESKKVAEEIINRITSEK